MTRLPLVPPYFPHPLNSYQRLLIHRLADTFGITRQVEPSPIPTWATTGNGGIPSGLVQQTVVLVKGDATKA